MVADTSPPRQPHAGRVQRSSGSAIRSASPVQPPCACPYHSPPSVYGRQARSVHVAPPRSHDGKGRRRTPPLELELLEPRLGGINGVPKPLVGGSQGETQGNLTI